MPDVGESGTRDRDVRAFPGRFDERTDACVDANESLADDPLRKTAISAHHPVDARVVGVVRAETFVDLAEGFHRFLERIFAGGGGFRHRGLSIAGILVDGY
ncbi:hypothetical protein D3C87_1822300 [compost metagenome]